METLEREVKSLNFYTTGEGLTGLIRMFVKEGSFHTAYNILKDGGMPEETVKEFIEGKWLFTGDTRQGDHTLAVEPATDFLTDTEFSYALLTALREVKHEISDLKHLASLSVLKPKYKNLTALFEIYTVEEILEKVWKIGLKQEQYPVFLGEIPKDKTGDGVILRNGAWVWCGYQGHRDLYQVLWKLGLASSTDWTDDDLTIHISSGQASGHIGYDLSFTEEHSLRGSFMTMEQAHTLFKMRNTIRGRYGEKGGILDKLNRQFVKFQNKGGKYGNLMFLKEFYPVIKLPEFSSAPLSDSIQQCIRTSPKYSIAGLLNSKFDINENSVKELEADWEKFKDVRKGNEFNYFYQQFIEGKNGVSLYENIQGDKPNFDYQLSEDRGNVVKGVPSTEVLSQANIRQLKELSIDLYKSAGKPVQLEFVVGEDDVLYVVQLRFMENAPTYNVIGGLEKNAIVLGTSFSQGDVTADVKDILIVESEADSTELIGKKALLVRGTPKFSHILALSASLGIPSMYGIGNVELSGELQIYTKQITGVIRYA